MRWEGPAGHWVSDDRHAFDMPTVHRWLSTESYWARGRSYEKVTRSFDHSLPLGLYDGAGTQVGVCRWVTDETTFAWLCDVFVDPKARGGGLGVFLVASATAHPAVTGVRLVLGTGDAHELYRRFGFGPLVAPERWMERP